MVLLILVDGVGVGPRSASNPLADANSPYFSHFEGERLGVPRGGAVTLTDARLGVEGLPQSATGQATIITGRNAAAFLGRHLSAFPGGSLRPLLRRESLFRRLLDRDARVMHANVAPASVARRRVRTVSAMTVAAEEAELPLRTLDDVAAGRALHHDFTNQLLVSYGCDVPMRTPEAAGRMLAGIAADVDFCGFEYFLTDAAGHAQDAAAVRGNIARLDAFLDAVLDSTDLARHTVVVTSDHGNVEDLSTSQHTLNPVATMAWGVDAVRVCARIESLEHVAGAIAMRVLGDDNALPQNRSR